MELQRSRRSRSAEGEVVVPPLREAEVASTEPPIEIGGGTATASRRGSSPSCFNGAADRDRRRAGDPSLYAAEERRCFNGAADRDRRRGQPVDDAFVIAVELQRSRRSRSAEGPRAQEVGHRDRAASTEPPIEIGGGVVLGDVPPAVRRLLQRSRRSRSAEGVHVWGSNLDELELQRSRRSRSAEGPLGE